MESLLRWGIQNSIPTNGDSTNPTPAPKRDLDPAIIDHILGKSDAVLMQEAIAIAVDQSKDEESRVTALDDLEMLVENIDNANNLGKLKIWESLQKLLISPTSSEPIKTQALWVIGTALQNNPAAQKSYLTLSPTPVLLNFISSTSGSPQTRSKALYALSGLLKHNATAVRELNAVNGWYALQNTFGDSDISVRRKTAFLLNNLLVPTSSLPPSTNDASAVLHTPDSGPAESAPVHANSHASLLSDPALASTSQLTLEALQNDLVGTVISALVSPLPFGPDGEYEHDVDLEEKLVRLLHTYATRCRGPFSSVQKKYLRSFLTEHSGAKLQADERMGLTAEELEALMKAVE